MHPPNPHNNGRFCPAFMANGHKRVLHSAHRHDTFTNVFAGASDLTAEDRSVCMFWRSIWRVMLSTMRCAKEMHLR